MGTHGLGFGNAWVIGVGVRRFLRDGNLGAYQAYNGSYTTEPVTAKEKKLVDVLITKDKKRDYFDTYLDFLLSEPKVELLLRARIQGKLIRVEYVEIQKTVVRFEFCGFRGEAPAFSPLLDFYDCEGLNSSLPVPNRVLSAGLFFYLVDRKTGKLLYRRGHAAYGSILSGLMETEDTLSHAEIRYLTAHLSENFGESFKVQVPAAKIRILPHRPRPVVEIDEQSGDTDIKLLFQYDQETVSFRDEKDLLSLGSRGEEFLVEARNREYELDRFHFLRAILANVIVHDFSDSSFLRLSGILFSLAINLNPFLIEYGEQLLEEGFELSRRGR